MKHKSPRRLTSRALVSAPLAIGVFLAASGCGGGSSHGGGGGAPQTVSSVTPAKGATSVPINTKLNAAFSGAMAPSTITATTFKLTGPGNTPVAGSISYVELTNIATFKPSSDLAVNTLFTATLTTGVTDLNGNPLAKAFVWTFTSAASADTTRPTVTFTAPVPGATGVNPNSNITATFSEAMDPASFTTASFTLSHGASDAGTVTYTDSGNVATFNPLQDLLVSTEYTATITNDAEDLAGNAMSVAYVWTFTTGAALDLTRPTVTFTNPADQATGVFINKSANATFSEAMDPTTITTLTYLLTGPGTTPVTGTVGYDGPSKIATFTPVDNLLANTLFTATVTTAVTDLAGNALLADKVWTFTTGSIESQPTVNLGAAGPFAVLAYATVTNDGPTVVTGDLGLSPGSAVVGFGPGGGTVNGTIHVANTTADLAIGAAGTAHTDAMGRSTNPIALPQDVSGLTLTPGLYKNASSIEINSGSLTLDAQGDSTAVWIFQTAGTMTMEPGTQILLIGGARAANVFWALGTAADLKTGAAAQGTILAATKVAFGTGATLTGRALALTDEVTLLSNTVTLPTP